MKRGLRILTVLAIALTVVTVFWMGGVEAERIRGWIEDLGWWAPLGYIVFYMVGTILLLPSTPLNVSGGLIFGVAQGLFWTSFAAVLAAMVSFFYARFLGHSWARQRFGGYLKKMDAEVKRGGYGISLLCVFCL